VFFTDAEPPTVRLAPCVSVDAVAVASIAPLFVTVSLPLARASVWFSVRPNGVSPPIVRVTVRDLSRLPLSASRPAASAVAVALPSRVDFEGDGFVAAGGVVSPSAERPPASTLLTPSTLTFPTNS
jgi:hypothetical protein